MLSRQDHRLFLIGTLVFGIVANAAAIRWVRLGSIEIRQGESTGRGEAPSPDQAKTPVVGRIESTDLLFYPLCAAWLMLATSMIVFPICTFFSLREIYTRLTSYCAAALLLLGFATVAAAYWYGE